MRITGDEDLQKQLIRTQENEATEAIIYSRLAGRVRDKKSKQILLAIARDEKRHAGYWKKRTQIAVSENTLKVVFFTVTAKLLGLTFAIKLMEKGEELAQINYRKISELIPDALNIEKEEKSHEMKLVNMLDDETLKYAVSIILGINDALVELTGALAGFTLALSNTKLIGMTGLISGVAASLSMGTSEYLSTQAEKQDRDPKKAAIYTGLTYLLTVILLIIPYFTLNNVYTALIITLVLAIGVILFFTFYVSVANDVSFSKRFWQMTGISLGVSALTFMLGYLVKKILGVNI